MSDPMLLSFTALSVFSLSATTYTQEATVGLDGVLVSPSAVSSQLDLRLHGISLLCVAIFSLLLFVQFDSRTTYVIAGSLLLFIFGVFDNLLGLLSQLKQGRAETVCCLICMFLSSLFVAHLGKFLGTSVFGLPVWIELPISLFSVLSIHNAVRLLDRTAAKY